MLRPKTDPITPKKTREAPHWIDIAIGVLSPLLAVVAIVFSYESVATSRQALQIGTQAYLTAKNGSIRVEVDDDPKSWMNFVNVYSQFTLENFGSTPAKKISVTLSVRSPLPWENRSPDPDPIADMPPKSTRNIQIKTVFALPHEEAEHFKNAFAVTDLKHLRQWYKDAITIERSSAALEFRKRFYSRKLPIDDREDHIWYELRFFQIDGIITFFTVFDKRENVSWCWITHSLSNQYPNDCKRGDSPLELWGGPETRQK